MMQEAQARTASDYLRLFVCLLFTVSLVLGTFALAGCGGSKDEQDNCYGEDMPVVNED